MQPGAHIPNKEQHLEGALSLLGSSQLAQESPIGLIRLHQPAKARSLLHGESLLNQPIQLRGQSLLIPSGEIVSYQTPHRTLGSRGTASASPLMTPLIPQLGRHRFPIRGRRGLKNTNGLSKTEQLGVGAKSEIKDRTAAMSQTPDQQKAGCRRLR